MDKDGDGAITLQEFVRWMNTPAADQVVLMPMDDQPDEWDRGLAKEHSRNFNALGFDKGGDRFGY